MKTFSVILFLLVVALLPLARAEAEKPSPTPAQLTPEQEKAADLRLPQLDRSGLLPDDRKPVEVKENERNPFGVTSKVADQMVVVAPVTEEKRIRYVLRAMKVAGFVASPSGPRVMLGSFSLGKGDQLPPLFVGQVEKLRVESISDSKLVLVFEKPDPEGGKRDVVLSYDMKPRVDSLHVGELFMKGVPLDSEGAIVLPSLTNAAAQATFDAVEQQEFQSLVERDTELLNTPAKPAGNESKKQKP